MIHLKAELEKLVEKGRGDTGLMVRSIQRGGLDIAINANQVFPSASVIKVPLACVVLSQAAANVSIKESCFRTSSVNGFWTSLLPSRSIINSLSNGRKRSGLRIKLENLAVVSTTMWVS